MLRHEASIMRRMVADLGRRGVPRWRLGEATMACVSRISGGWPIGEVGPECSGGTEKRSIFATVFGSMPNTRAARRWLMPSTWQARRTRA